MIYLAGGQRSNVTINYKSGKTLTDNWMIQQIVGGIIDRYFDFGF